MPVYAVLPDNIAVIPAKIGVIIPHGDALKLPGGAWLVSYSGTTKELTEVLGISDGNPTAGVVVSVTSYWGRATPDVWEWLQLKLK